MVVEVEIVVCKFSPFSLSSCASWRQRSCFSEFSLQSLHFEFCFFGPYFYYIDFDLFQFRPSIEINYILYFHFGPQTFWNWSGIHKIFSIKLLSYFNFILQFKLSLNFSFISVLILLIFNFIINYLISLVSIFVFILILSFKLYLLYMFVFNFISYTFNSFIFFIYVHIYIYMILVFVFKFSSFLMLLSFLFNVQFFICAGNHLKINNYYDLSFFSP